METPAHRHTWSPGSHAAGCPTGPLCCPACWGPWVGSGAQLQDRKAGTTGICGRELSVPPPRPALGRWGWGWGSDCCDQEHREKQLGEINCGRGRNMVRPQSINPEKMVSGPRGEAQRVCAPTGKELLHPPGSMWVMCAVTAESLLTGFQLR